MFFDFQGYAPAGELLVYPDWPFAAVPRTNVREQVILQGGSTRAGTSVTATADQQEK